MSRFSVRVAWMERHHLEGVLAVEQACFDQGAWTEGDFISVLHRRECVGKVAVDLESDDVVGFMVYEVHKYSLRILSIAVHPDRRRQGIATRMVGKLTGALSDKRNCVEAVVGEWSLGTQLFFKAAGFEAECVLRNFYHNGADGYAFTFMDKTLIAPAEEV